jgi:hypothetical protein
LMGKKGRKERKKKRTCGSRHGPAPSTVPNSRSWRAASRDAAQSPSASYTVARRLAATAGGREGGAAPARGGGWAGAPASAAAHWPRNVSSLMRLRVFYDE